MTGAPQQIASDDDLLLTFYDRLPGKLTSNSEMLMNGLWRAPEHQELQANQILQPASARRCGNHNTTRRSSSTGDCAHAAERRTPSALLDRYRAQSAPQRSLTA